MHRVTVALTDDLPAGLASASSHSDGALLIAVRRGLTPEQVCAEVSSLATLAVRDWPPDRCDT